MCLTVSSLSHSRSAQRPSAAKYRHTRHKQRDVTESVSFCCRHVTFQLRAAGWRLDGGGWVEEAGSAADAEADADADGRTDDALRLCAAATAHVA